MNNATNIKNKTKHNKDDQVKGYKTIPIPESIIELIHNINTVDIGSQILDALMFKHNFKKDIPIFFKIGTIQNRKFTPIDGFQNESAFEEYFKNKNNYKEPVYLMVCQEEKQEEKQHEIH